MPPTATAATDEASMAVTATTAVRGGGRTSSEQMPGAVGAGAGGRACVFQPLSARAPFAACAGFGVLARRDQCNDVGRRRRRLLN